LRHKIKGSWDAQTYDQISCLVQYRWGQQVIELRSWHGNEIVMDAGCGTGLLTRDLAKKVPSGRVYASFTDVKLPGKVDVIFSNSAFHWVQDHRKALKSFWGMLKTTKINNVDDGTYPSRTDSSGQLLIQCGAYGTYYHGIRKNCTFSSIQSILHRLETTMAFC